MTTRSLLLCCGALATIASIQAPIANASSTHATVAMTVPISDPDGFPGTVLEFHELIIEEGQTLRYKGPVELRVGGEVRIEGSIIVDGVEAEGRPNLTIKALGPITIARGSVLETKSVNPGAHGGSIRLMSAESINLHSELKPSPGQNGSELGQPGGDGGDIVLDARTIRTSVKRIEAAQGGTGGPGGDGGSGGSAIIRGGMLWTGHRHETTTIMGGKGGRGGVGAQVADPRYRNGGRGGNGGNATHRDWQEPDWLRDVRNIRVNEHEAKRANDGQNGEPGVPGADGKPGIHADGGHGGSGGNGSDAKLSPHTSSTIEIWQAGHGGSGGIGGNAEAGPGGNGGDGGNCYSLPPDHPASDLAGGDGGNGAPGGNATAGRGGDPGLAGESIERSELPAGVIARSSFDGHPGHPGHAHAGNGGAGGDGGNSKVSGGIAGVGGAGGIPTAARGGLHPDEVRNPDAPIRLRSGHARRGQSGHNGQNGFPRPKILSSNP